MQEGVFYREVIENYSLGDVWVNFNRTNRIFFLFVCAVLAGCFGYAAGGQGDASAVLGEAVDDVRLGRWDAALELLGSVQGADDCPAWQIRGLLLEHWALTRQRAEQRRAVFEQKLSDFASVDLAEADEARLFEAMGLFKSAWDNAEQAEREQLLDHRGYRALRGAVEAQFYADYQAGHWDEAWRKWLRWLDLFEPEHYRLAVEDSQERRALVNAIRVNPCDETAVPYAQVRRDIAVRMLELLEANYARPVPFDDAAKAGLRRLSLLPEVLGNPTVALAVQADSDTFAAWTEHLDSLQSAPLPTSACQVAGVLDMLLAINAKTLTLPEGVIVAQFIEAALAALDPYTEAVWPEGVGAFDKTITGQFGGVGVRIRKDDGQLVIVSVIPDTPAAETFLAADDVIEAVDGRSTRDLPTECVAALISGPVGTSVSLTVIQAGTEEKTVVTVTRRQVVLPTVEGAQRAENKETQGRWDYFLDAKDRIGYLHLNGFTNRTADQAREVLECLESQGLGGLIVDMRGNGGGLLSEAAAFADLFVSDGVLLSSRGRNGTHAVWKAHSNSVRRDYPIVMLIDEGSASASEIVAGAVAARKGQQVTLIGQRTYGKGTVQDVVGLGDVGGRLKLTTAYYYLPDGRPVQNRYSLQAEGQTDWGIEPAIELPLYAYERTRIREIQNQRRRQLMQASDPTCAEAQHESLVRQMLMADAQLSTAVVVLKAQILAAQ